MSEPLFMVRALTTCSAAGWRDYGRRMVESWVQHWPVPLVLWREGFACPGVSRDLTAVDWLARFKREHPYKLRGRYNYRFDAARFAHKTAAVIEEATLAGMDWLIWIDADTVTHASVPAEFVASLLPRGDEYIAWLDREGKYPEAGFYVLNLRHPQHAALMAEWKRLHTSGELFALDEWHDSYVLQYLVERFGLRTKSLSGPEARLTAHPFINSRLGAYCDHLKGPRKRVGRSHASDIKVERTEAYWTQPITTTMRTARKART